MTKDTDEQSHSGKDGKHVHYDDPACSGSDDDTKAFEVTFDAGNPYRRKSSLVSTESSAPHLGHRSKKTQCLVHQLLENPGARSNTYKTVNGHPDSAEKHERKEDATAERALDRYVEPKGVDQSEEKASAADLDSGDSTDVGQTDEKMWTRTLSRKRSDPDIQAQGLEAMHSRLLTKQQLSEMAWGVRELSRRLGSMRLKFKARSIFILTKVYDYDLVPKAREVTRWLLSREREVRHTVYLERSLKGNKALNVAGLLEELRKEYIEAGEMDEDAPIDDLARRLRFWDEEMCRTKPHTFDFVITLGGDGTVLYASWLFQRIVPPVLSFALGSLGFLTKFDFNDYQDILDKSFNDGVTVSLRLRFEGTVMRTQKTRQQLQPVKDMDEEEVHKKRDLVDELVGEEKDDEHTHKPDGTYEILNEIVVDRGPNPTMSYTEIFGDDEHFTSVLADGVCVSTPTGSTAYNLAAGGSLCHPENPVMLVTSICAHTLSFRPIILPDTIVLRIGVPYDARTNSWASFDGRERIELFPGDYVTISASRFPFASVQPHGRRSEDWVNSISGKLGWNTRQKQKNEGYRAWNN
ncbi:hypothetical protein DL768_007034 [Monosporascus sp. mg162]|nr:hypothetical protein DL768_007034 [Monosporascus sp. mg162]